MTSKESCKCMFHENSEYKWIYSLSGYCPRFTCPECFKVLIRELA